MMDIKMASDGEILAGIHSNHLNETIYHIYRQYTEVVCDYVVNNGGSRQDGEDVLQETVIAFIDLVKTQKFRGDASIKTFLGSIARHIWLNEIKKKKSLGNRAKIFETGRDQTENDIADNLNQREIKQQFLHLMGRLGGSCKQILTLFYYENLSFKEIVGRMQYENEQVARNKKFKCIKELTDLIRDNPILLGNIKNMD
jgi:RNA polymerase sigma factor (sigma-70 family)